MIARSVLDEAEMDGWELEPLSRWFGPFLRPFAREALRSRGSVRVALSGRRVVGLALEYPAERTATVFGTSPETVRALADPLRGRAVFSELSLDPRNETYRILSIDPTELPAPMFRHTVRLLDPSEVPGCLAALAGAYGRSDEPSALPMWGSDEAAFLATVNGVPAGLAWASVVGAHSRLHSVWVAPGFRRIGIGTDLLLARLLWARTAGARSAISEVASGNVASLATAARAGMRPVGEMYLRSPT